MPTRINVPNFGSIDFPDEMSLDDITSALRKEFPPQSETESKWVIQDTLSRLGKDVAEQGAQAIQGVARGLSIASAQTIPANLRAIQMQAEMAGEDTSILNPVIAQASKAAPARAMQATQENPFYQFGRDIEETAGQFYQPNPAYDDTVRAKLVQGVSSTVPVLASGPLAPITYAGMMGETGAREAEAKGASPEKIADTFLANAALGMTSEFLLGVPYLLRSAKAIKGVAAEVSKTALGKRLAALTAKHPVASLAARGAVAEGIQEGPIEQVGQNAIAKFVGQYDTERPIFQDVAEQAAYGAAIGLLLGGLFGGAASIDKARAAKRATTKAPDQFQDHATGEWLSAAEYGARQPRAPETKIVTPFIPAVTPTQEEQDAIALRVEQENSERERARIAAQLQKERGDRIVAATQLSSGPAPSGGDQLPQSEPVTPPSVAPVRADVIELPSLAPDAFKIGNPVDFTTPGGQLIGNVVGIEPDSIVVESRDGHRTRVTARNIIPVTKPEPIPPSAIISRGRFRPAPNQQTVRPAFVQPIAQVDDAANKAMALLDELRAVMASNPGPASLAIVKEKLKELPEGLKPYVLADIEHYERSIKPPTVAQPETPTSPNRYPQDRGGRLSPPNWTQVPIESATVAQPATAEAPAIKIGDEQTIMQVPSVLADTKTIGGVRWDLFNGASLKEKRAAVRVIDDSGEVLQLKQFPTYDAAESYYKSETEKAQKMEAPAKPPVEAKAPFPTLLEFAKSKLPKATADKITSETQVESFRAQWEKERGVATGLGNLSNTQLDKLAVEGGRSEREAAAKERERRRQAPAEAKAKEPWEMTKAEWGQNTFVNPSIAGIWNVGSESIPTLRNGPRQIKSKTAETAKAAIHKQEVTRAIREGKTITPEVLADYPDLAPKAPPAVEPVPKTVDTLPSKKVQDSIDRAIQAADLLGQETKKQRVESLYATLKLHAGKLGIEHPGIGTYFSLDEYRKAADAVRLAIGQKYGTHPTEKMRSKRDAATTAPVPAPKTVTPTPLVERSRDELIRKERADAIAALDEQLKEIKRRRKAVRAEFKGVKPVSPMNRTTPKIERGQKFQSALNALEIEEHDVGRHWAKLKKEQSEEAALPEPPLIPTPEPTSVPKILTPANVEKAQVSDDVTWKTGAGDMARSTGTNEQETPQDQNRPVQAEGVSPVASSGEARGRSLVEEGLQHSGAVLWGSSNELEQVITDAGRTDRKAGERVQGAEQDLGRGVHSGTADGSGEVFQTARMLVERTPENEIPSTWRQINLLAHRILFGTDKPETKLGGFDFVSTLFKKLPGLKIYIHDFGARSGYANYYQSRSGDFDFVEINVRELGRFDLSKPADMAFWNAAVIEELLHGATLRTSTKRELEAVWHSLTGKESATVQAIYTTPQTESNYGAEYIRIILQKRLTGEVSEMHSDRNLKEPARTVLQNLVRFLKRIFGLKPADNIARQVIERIESAIKGDSPIAGIIFDESQSLSTDISRPSGVRTQMQGSVFEVKSATASPVNRAAGLAGALDKFRQAGLPASVDTDGNVSLDDGDGWPPRQLEGVKLLQLTNEAAAEMSELAQLGAPPNDRNVRFLDSVRHLAERMQAMIGRGEETAFDQPLVHDLMSIGQGVPSEIGRLFQLFDNGQRDFVTRLRKVDVELRMALNERFNGQIVRKVLMRAAEHFRDFLTDAEIKILTDKNTEIAKLFEMLANRTANERGSYVYRVAQARMKPQIAKTIKWLEEDAKRKEAVAQILQNFEQMDGKLPEKKNAKLTPREQLLLLAQPETAELLDKAIAKAVREAERKAARHLVEAELKTQGLSNEEVDVAMGLYDDSTSDPRIIAHDPSPEQIEQGFQSPTFAHWKVVRDSLLGYSPVTDALIRKVIAGVFRGTKFDKPGAPKPTKVKIDLNALAKSPDVEAQRILDAHAANLESELAAATPFMRARIKMLILEGTKAQLAKARQRFLDSFFEPRQFTRLAPSEKLKQLLNAGVENDERFRDPLIKKLVAKLASTPAADFDEQATRTRDEKNGWIQDRLIEISQREGWENLSDDTRAFFEAVTFTKLAEGLQAAEERITRRFLGGQDISFTPKTPATLAEQEARRNEAKSKLEGIIRAGGIDTVLVEQAARKSAVQKFTPTLTKMVQEILDTPTWRHDELAEKFANRLLDEFSLDPALRDKARGIFQSAFRQKLGTAAVKAVEAARTSLTPREQNEIPTKKLLWKRLVEMANAKGFDTLDTLKDVAEKHHWEIGEPDLARMRALAAQEQKLSKELPDETLRQIGLTRDQLTKYDRTGKGLTPEEAAKLSDERLAQAAITTVEQNEIHHKMVALWARMTKPINVTSVEGGRNLTRAINDLSVINILTRWTFGTIQAIDVATQSFFHNLFTAIAHANLRNAALPDSERSFVSWMKEQWQAFGINYNTAKATWTAGYAALWQGLRSGKGLPQRIESVETGVHTFSRMAAKADELLASANPVDNIKGVLFWLQTEFLFGRRITGALDQAQSEGARFKEFAQMVRTYLRVERGYTAAQAETWAKGIIGDIKSELALAATRAPMVLEANEVTNPTRADRHVAAWHLVWSRMLDRAKTIGLSVEEVTDLENRIKKRMQTLSWNRPERSWIGKISATPLKAIEEAGAHVFIPTSLITSFANALSMSAAQKFFYSPLGFLARSGFFSGSPSAETPLDREVIMAKATFGTAIGGMLAVAAATGLIKVILRWPDDKKEREEMAALNLKPGMVLFPLPGGGFFSVSMTAGPLALVSPELAAGAAVYEVNQRKAKAQQKLNEAAAKNGTAPARVEGWGAKDVLHVAGVVGLDMLAGTRTAGGKAGSFTDYGQIVSDKAIAGWVSSKIPFLPLFQNTMQLRGIDIDPRMAGAFWDMLVPLDSSGSRRVNMLGDTVADTRNATDILSMFTRGTGKILSGGELKGSDAYSTLFGSGYSPPSIPQRKGYDINGEFRPMTAKELQRYTVERGKAFKQELEALGSLDGLDSADARKAAQGAFQRANQRALASVGVSEVKPKRAYTRRLRSIGGITRRGRSFGVGRIRRGRTPGFGKLRPARSPRLKRTVLSGTRKPRVQRIVPANY